MRIDDYLSLEGLQKIKIQEEARPLLEAALNEVCPRVTQAGLFWRIENFNLYSEKVNEIIRSFKLQYACKDVAAYIQELSDRLLEKYKSDRGYRPNPAEKNSTENLKNLHHELTISLEDRTDSESSALRAILNQCSPTSIIVRHVYNYLEQKNGRSDFTDEEKLGMDRLALKIKKPKSRPTFEFAANSPRSESLEPPKIEVTAQSLNLQ